MRPFLTATLVTLALVLGAACADETATGNADIGAGTADAGDGALTFRDGGAGDTAAGDGATDGSGDGAAAGPEWDHRVGQRTVGEIVSHYAPLYYHDTDTGGPDNLGALGDLFTAVDFDGDRRHNNNWEHLPGTLPEAVVYYALVATDTHFYLTFSGYHARDWEKVCLGLTSACHEGDMETVVIMAQRSTATGYGKPILVLTQAHGRVSAWSNPGDGVTAKLKRIDGPYDFADDSGTKHALAYSLGTSHLRVYVQERGHGPIVCRAAEKPPLLGYFGFLEGVRCEKGATWDPGYFGNNGLTLRFVRGKADRYAPAWNGIKAQARYDVVGLLDTMWAWRGEIGKNKLYRSSDPLTYTGARGGAFKLSSPAGTHFDVEQFINDLSTGKAPWAQKLVGSATGDLFLDPAHAVSEAFKFDHTVSKKYVYHPYLPGAVNP